MAGKNDPKLLEETKVGRNINRHYFTEEEIAEEVKRPVVEKLIRLMEFRNSFPAFDGSFAMKECEDGKLVIVREKATAIRRSWRRTSRRRSLRYTPLSPEVRGRSWINKASAVSDWLLSAIVYIECV